MSASSGSSQDVAAAMRRRMMRAAAAEPTVRGGDGRLAVVQTVGSDGTITTTDGIIARRLESYRNPTGGDLVALLCFSSGIWIALDRTATGADTAWTSYTPTWTSSGTAPALGNGTLVGRYMRVDGRTIVAHINLTIGSTTTLGTGNYSFALPVASANAGASIVGCAQLLAGATRYLGQNVISPNVLTTSPFFPTNSTTTTASQLSGTVPIALATNNQVRITTVYEAAS